MHLDGFEWISVSSALIPDSRFARYARGESAKNLQRFYARHLISGERVLRALSSADARSLRFDLKDLGIVQLEFRAANMKDGLICVESSFYALLLEVNN